MLFAEENVQLLVAPPASVTATACPIEPLSILPVPELASERMLAVVDVPAEADRTLPEIVRGPVPFMARVRGVAAVSVRKTEPERVSPPLSLLVRVLLAPELVKLPPRLLKFTATAPPTVVLAVRSVTLSIAPPAPVAMSLPAPQANVPVPIGPLVTAPADTVSAALSIRVPLPSSCMEPLKVLLPLEIVSVDPVLPEL